MRLFIIRPRFCSSYARDIRRATDSNARVCNTAIPYGEVFHIFTDTCDSTNDFVSGDKLVIRSAYFRGHSGKEN